MRIGFFGTPELSARVLAGLSKRHQILFAVTGEDKASGRNRLLRPCPAKEAAGNLGIPVLQPSTLKDDSFIAEIARHNADVYVVVAYGKLIPRAVFALPPLGTVNLHPSLLPQYRGAAPIQWALMNGEIETGITVQLINERLDAGDILLQERIAVHPDATAGDILEIVASRGPELIDRAITSFADGTLRPYPQDESLATYCGKIDRTVSRIQWSALSSVIHNLVRALNPKPGSHTTFRGEHIIIWKTSLFNEGIPVRAGHGTVAAYRKKRLLACTGDGYIEILFLQPAGRKTMDALSFINGYRLKEGERFE